MKTSSSPCLLTTTAKVDAKQEELKRVVNFVNFCQTFMNTKSSSTKWVISQEDKLHPIQFLFGHPVVHLHLCL